MYKETSSLIYTLYIVYFKFLLYNLLNSVRNIYWQMFLKGRLLFQTIISAVAKESLIPYHHTQTASTRNVEPLIL